MEVKFFFRDFSETADAAGNGRTDDVCYRNCLKRTLKQGGLARGYQSLADQAQLVGRDAVHWWRGGVAYWELVTVTIYSHVLSSVFQISRTTDLHQIPSTHALTSARCLGVQGPKLLSE